MNDNIIKLEISQLSKSKLLLKNIDVFFVVVDIVEIKLKNKSNIIRFRYDIRRNIITDIISDNKVLYSEEHTEKCNYIPLINFVYENKDKIKAIIKDNL